MVRAVTAAAAIVEGVPAGIGGYTFVYAKGRTERRPGHCRVAYRDAADPTGAVDAYASIGRCPMLSPLSATPSGDATEGSIDDLLVLIRAEYDEMPGLTLTPAQVCRLFGIDPARGDTVMRKLVEAGVLVRSANGAYMRRRALM
jgi:hypothetical protein